MTPPDHHNTTPPAPLPAVLTLVWLGSFSTAIGWFVMFFVAKHLHAFNPDKSLALGLVAGTTYTVSAFFAGNTVAAIRKRKNTPLRSALAIILAASAITAALPAILGEPGLWIFAVANFALTGLLWPTTQAFLSGGRSGKQLRTASGRFNIAWSSSVIVASFLASPLVELAPNAIFLGLAALFAICILTLPFYPADPPGSVGPPQPDPNDPHHPSPEAAARQLRTFRILNFSSYTTLAALSPILPEISDRLGIEVKAQTALGATWMLTRFAAFVTLERWHAWHGNNSTAIATPILLALGLAGSFLAQSPLQLVAALAILGLGAGTAYAGAIYHALHAQSGKVNAGARHEAIIGSGYTLGPLLALAIIDILNW